MHQDSAFAIKNINSPMFLVNFICSNLPFKKDEKMDLLSIHSLRERTYHLLEILNREVQLAEIKASIQMRAREDIDQQQREYFLQQQIKTCLLYTSFPLVALVFNTTKQIGIGKKKNSVSLLKQTSLFTDNSFHTSCFTGIDPVSYTHLDVYKRQSPSNTLILNIEMKFESTSIRRTTNSTSSFLIFFSFQS